MAPLLTPGAARERVLAAVAPLAGTEDVPVAAGAGRVLAAPLRAAADVPALANSAMDGFAVAAGAAGRRLRIAGESRAGAPSGRALAAGEAARISTGAALPAGAEAVVRVEETEEDGADVLLRVGAEPGANVRAAGGDLRAGAAVLPAGAVLGVAELAAAVAAGAGTLRVARRPRVAVVGTGDELRPAGTPLAPGEIHDANGPALAALAVRAGGEVVHADTVPDDRDATEAALAAALEAADVVLVVGGVSVGAHDHVRPALRALGVQERFWRVALQPGKPTWFGTRGRQLVLGLPGNPVSAVVTAWLFAVPALRALQGAPPLPPEETARLTEALPRTERTQAVRVRLTAGADGTLRATSTGAQNSHLVTSLRGADGLAFVTPGEGEAAAGSLVPVERWGGVV